jgi:hypothetical protein
LNCASAVLLFGGGGWRLCVRVKLSGGLRLVVRMKLFVGWPPFVFARSVGPVSVFLSTL